jgi:hypothetical protein
MNDSAYLCAIQLAPFCHRLLEEAVLLLSLREAIEGEFRRHLITAGWHCTIRMRVQLGFVPFTCLGSVRLLPNTVYDIDLEASNPLGEGHKLQRRARHQCSQPIPIIFRNRTKSSVEGTNLELVGPLGGVLVQLLEWDRVRHF